MPAADVAIVVSGQLLQQLWQGLLLAAVLAVSLHVLRRTSAATRHACCATALVGLLALPLLAWLPLPARVPKALTTTASSGSSVTTAATDPTPFDTPRSARGGNRPIAQPTLRHQPVNPAVVRSLTPIAAWAALAVWLSGSAWGLARLVVDVLRGERLRRTARPWLIPAGHGGRGPEVRTTSRVTSPLVVGLIRPTILLPTGFERSCPATDLDCVLAHEWAHVVRRDGWWHLLQRTAEALFFFSPGVRFIARRMEFEREAACDDWAAARTGGLRAYSASLLNVSATVCRAPQPILAVGALFSKSQLARRVDNMLDLDKDHRPRKSLGWVTLFGATCTVVVATLAVVFPAPVSARDIASTDELPGATPLIRAARNGNAAEVARLLGSGADPNETARHEPRSPLYAAAVNGDVATVRTLLDAGAGVDRIVRGDATPLMAACRRGNLAAARLLVERGADVDIALRGDGTPLINAAAGGNPEIVALLLDRGADPSRAIRGDGNPLIAASRHGNDAIVQMLLAAGAEPDDRVPGDGSPLINAAASGDTRAVDTLLAAGADPDLPVHGDGNPLIVAVARGDVAMVDRLLRAGADPNRSVSGDGSPLIQAAQSGRLATVEALVDAGADVDMAVSGDGNPLIAASAAGHVEIVRFLLARGATVDAIVPGDETALINAASRGRADVALLLLDAGADPNLGVRADTWRGGRSRVEIRSPLAAARARNDTAMVDLLIRHGAAD